MTNYSSRIPTGIVATALLLSLLACERHAHPPHPSSGNPSLPEPVLPPGYQKIAPTSATTSRDILSQTAAIIEGDVSDVQFTYDDCAGPRTNYTLTGVRTLAGSEVPPQVTLSLFGGPLPNGSWIKTSELPRLALDSHYIAFVRNTDWTFSPIVGDVILRQEDIAGRQVLVSPEGQLVSGWGEQGVTLSVPVTTPVGRSIHGYRTADALRGPEHLPTASPSADPQTTQAEPGTPPPGRARAPLAQVGSPLSSAPSAQQIRTAGFFARPAIIDSTAAARGISSEAFISAVKSSAHRDNLTITGRTTFIPLWRCWSFTRTTLPFRGSQIPALNTR